MAKDPVSTLAKGALLETPRPKRKASPSAFKPGHAKVGGRKKGTKNAFTRDMKEAVLSAFNELGGKDWLVKMGKSRLPADKRAMLGVFARMLPMELTGKDGGPIETKSSVQVYLPDNKRTNTKTT